MRAPAADVTTTQSPDRAELPTADEQLLRELTERARTGGNSRNGHRAKTVLTDAGPVE